MALCKSVLIITFLVVGASAFNWQDGDNGKVKWSADCDFYGGDIDKKTGGGEQCGGFCLANSQCTHFTYYSGVCYLKRFTSPATATNLAGGVCGWKVGGDPGPGPGPAPGPTKQGKTTRYWDCCKPSCSWAGKGPANPVKSCAKDGITTIGVNEQSGCDNGPAFSCSNNAPWSVSDTLSYGFAAFGYQQTSPCCKCFKLDFTSGPVVGKSMIVQVTNSGGDLSEAHFDLQIPGGGVGLFNGCSRQWGAPSPNGWGQRYGGVGSLNECYQLPGQLQEGCKWRFTWFKGADNPTVNYSEVACPDALIQRTGCRA